MDKTIAIIKKVGNKYCVFSEDGTKNLGCSLTLQGAKKRLQQVEYFKHKDSANMTDYNEFFDRLGKLATGAESQLDRPNVGTVAGQTSDRILDCKEHFPIVTETQAQSSMARVMQLREIPSWFGGSLAELREIVYAGIKNTHPALSIDVKVPVQHVVCLSDGQTPSETKVKDPYDERKTKTDEVPQVARPTLTSADFVRACEDQTLRQTVAGTILEMIEEQGEAVERAKSLCQKLLKSGLKADEFDLLSTYLQSDILRELLMNQSKSSTEDRRLELIKKMKN
jgi:hypothetical protein